MKKLSTTLISEIEHFGKATHEGINYRYKDYLYKSEIYADGKLIIRIDNKKTPDDPSRIEYVEEVD